MATILRPNPSSGVPVYVQLMEQLKDAVQSGALRPGEPLPGIRPLAQELVINPNTVARAYQELASQGFISVCDASGPSVAFMPESGASPEPVVERRGSPASGFVERLRIERDREMEGAREVQQRLFPQDCSQFPGFDYCGHSRPALGVGGDYYDFIRLSDTQLGIAIGDVSGKGMPAALLMATLRAYLRGQTMGRVDDLGAVMALLNKLVYESSSANRFASCFYGQYDSSTRVLDYVNAGHNPPFIVRTRNGQREIVRLDATGPVVGMMPGCAYFQRSVTLEPGDVLIAFTDGISEAMNLRDEEFGEERLSAAIERYHTLEPREIVERLMGEADAFAAGAAQHDDMTVVVAHATGR